MRLYILLAVFAALMAVLITRVACAAGMQGRPRVGPAPQDVRDQFIEEPAGIDVQPWVQNLGRSVVAGVSA